MENTNDIIKNIPLEVSLAPLLLAYKTLLHTETVFPDRKPSDLLGSVMKAAISNYAVFLGALPSLEVIQTAISSQQGMPEPAHPHIQ